MEAHTATDSEYIRRIGAGQKEAFHALVRQYHPQAYSLAYKVLDDSQDAEEVVQDAFVKIYRALEGFRGEASLKTWILRIVLRLSLNRRRDRARSSWYRLGLHRNSSEETVQVAQIADWRAQTPESLCISREARQRLRRMLDELPQSLREVVILNSFEELSYEEIARIVKVPVGTVSSRLHSARKKLMKKIKRDEL